MLDNNLNIKQLTFTTNPRSNTIFIKKIPGDLSKTLFNNIESIVFGGAMDHNFCNPAIKILNLNYFNNRR